MKYDGHFGYFEKTDQCVLIEYLEKNILSATEAVIPETFNGKPVTAVGEKAFKDAVYLERVTFPDSVDTIERGAFSGCSSLREIVWGTGLGLIGDEAFEYCASLEHLEIPEGTFTIEDFAFYECISLKEAVLPRSLESVCRGSFQNCRDLEKIVFLNKEVSVWDFAFNGCEKLPVETLMYSLTGTCDTERPFPWYSDFVARIDFPFDWDTALREEVFEFAMERDSFKDFDQAELIGILFEERLMERYFPYMKKYGRIYGERQINALAAVLREQPADKLIPMLSKAKWFADKKLFTRLCSNLLDMAWETGNTELAAWLLEYRNRNFGFDPEDIYEL